MSVDLLNVNVRGVSWPFQMMVPVPFFLKFSVYVPAADAGVVIVVVYLPVIVAVAVAGVTNASTGRSDITIANRFVRLHQVMLLLMPSPFDFRVVRSRLDAQPRTRTRLVVFRASSRDCASRGDRSIRRYSCLQGSPWDRRRSRENPEPAEGESARRPDPQHAAVGVVVDPDRAEADGEADWRPVEMESRDQPAGMRVYPVEIGRVDDGGPDGAEGEHEPDRMRLGDRCRGFPRASVDPSNGVSASAACPPDAGLIGGPEPARGIQGA